MICVGHQHVLQLVPHFTVRVVALHTRLNTHDHRIKSTKAFSLFIAAASLVCGVIALCSTEAAVSSARTIDTNQQSEQSENIINDSVNVSRSDMQSTESSVTQPGDLVTNDQDDVQTYAASDSSGLGISGTSSIMIQAGKSYMFLDGINTVPAKQDWTDGNEYRVVVTSVTGESGCSYIYKNGDTSFTPSKNDDGKKYTISYMLQSRKNGSAWTNCNVTAEKELIVYAVNEIKDELGDDEAFIKLSSITDVIDGSSPWDADNAAGNDSSDHNKIVRSWDIATYNVSYTTSVYENGTSYKNGYVNFRFSIPFSEEQVAFDTDSMSWMSTDPQHMWTITKTSLGGKTVQTLSCSKRLTSQGGNESAIPGSGEVYLQLRILTCGNGTKISPNIQVYMPGNSTGTKCSKHNNIEKQELSGTEITVSAVPSYNVVIARSNRSAEKSSYFDFTTGTNDAPNKGYTVNGESVHGRIVRYATRLELRNRSVQNGTDKGKDKRLKGIEIPEGPITFDLNVSTTFRGMSGKEYDLSSMQQYTPRLWMYSTNLEGGCSVSQGRNVDGMYAYSPDNVPYDNKKATIARNGNESSIYTTSDGVLRCQTNVWNGGKITANQLGNKITASVNNYEINPKYFPATVGWGPNTDNNFFNYRNGIYNIGIGIFNVGTFLICVPYGNGDDYLPTKYNEGGTVRLKINDANLQATSITGQKLPTALNDSSNQSVSSDDSYTEGVFITRPGSYRNTVWFSPYNIDSPSWRGSGGGDDNVTISNGRDSVTAGGNVRCSFGVIQDAQGDEGKIVQAFDVLLKYDCDALILDETNPIYCNWNGSKIFYGVKNDGTNWSDVDDMNNTRIEDLKYYDSISEAKKHGKIVGMMWSFRDPANTRLAYNDYFSCAHFTASTDSSIAGHVAAVTEESNAWYRYRDESGKLTQNDAVPYLADVQNGKASINDYTGNGRYISNRYGNYKKTEYDADGSAREYVSGNEIGDSMLIVAYTSKISIVTAQNSENNETKKIYDLDNNQYDVDYKITPSFPTVTGTTYNGKTTMTIKITLPPGLEYKPGSTNWAGTYTASSMPGYSGTISGGKQVDPKVTKNSSGYTVLEYVISDVNVLLNMPSLYLSAEIDSTTKRNVEFSVTAQIQTTEDLRAPSSDYGNYSNYSIKTSRTTDISLKTKAKKTMNDVVSVIGYDMSWSNNATANYDDAVMLSILPKNGDSNGSKFNGTYSIVSAKLTSNNIDHTKYEVWYTTDVDGYNISTEDDKGVDAVSIRSGKAGGVKWIKASVSSDGTISLPTNGVTSYAIIGTIKGGGNVDASLELLPKNNKNGDRYVNTIWLTNSTTQASAYIVRRMLSGVAWIDWNANGRRDSEELKLAGVKVSLIDSSGNPIRNLSGDLCEALTDADGAYTFDNLPSGSYRVKFSSGETFIGKYRQSVALAVGVANTVNSDAVGRYDSSGVLLDAATAAIIMPATNDIVSSPYVVQNIDAGYTPIINLPMTGGNRSIGIGRISLIAFCFSAAVAAFTLGIRKNYEREKKNKTSR